MRKGLLLVALLSSMLLGGLARPHSAAAIINGCDPNVAIMTCGANNPQTFINKVKHNGHGDLPAIYSQYGLRPERYDEFASSAKEGTLNASDGSIVVNGYTVAYSQQNIGRKQDANFNQKLVIDGHTYWGGTFAKTYGASSTPVMVWFDQFGIARIAILNGTGAPQKVYAVTETPTCHLTAQPVAGQPNTYDFTTDASATNGATIPSVEYNFGDGNKIETNDLGTPYRHQFSKSSVVHASPRIQMPATGTIWAYADPNCAQTITYATPSKATTTAKPAVSAQPAVTTTTTDPDSGVCESLTAQLTDAAHRSYQFTAASQVGSNTTLTGATYDFGDGVTSTNVQPNGTNVIISHSYNDVAAHTVTATFQFADKTTPTHTWSADCQTTVPATAAQTTAATATPASTNTDATSNGKGGDLINTGPGTIVFGVFGVTVALAGAANFYFRRRLGL